MFSGDALPKFRWSPSLQPEDADPGPDRPCVLVVDDNPVNLVVASEMLSSWGIKALLAVDGTEAVALACELRLDLILMDLHMPVLDGFEATRRIRGLERDHSRTRVPVVAYTSDSSVDQLRMRECGIDAVLDKPCDAQALHECLLRWCPPTGTPAADGDSGYGLPGDGSHSSRVDGPPHWARVTTLC